MVKALNLKRLYLNTLHKRCKLRKSLRRIKNIVLANSFKRFKTNLKNKIIHKVHNYEIEEHTALFKYKYKLLSTAFKCLYKVTKNTGRKRLLRSKSKRIYWTKLATLGLTLFIKNSIYHKDRINLALRVIFCFIW